MTTTRAAQRGSILLYAMLSMAVMLAIGLALSSLFIGKLRAAAAARNAMVALYAADSASEICLYEARTGKLDPALVMNNTATFTITDVKNNLDVTADCSKLGTGSFDFRATGNFRGSSRALEISQ